MEFLIASLIALAAFGLSYNLLYRRRVVRTETERRLASAYSVTSQETSAGPQSPEYRLAAAGLASGHPRLTWLLLNYGPAAAVLIVAVGAGLPPLVTLGAMLVALVAPRQWLSGRIKDRGRRLEADLPQVYVELLAILRASPDVAAALAEAAAGLEREKGPNPLSDELRLTAQEASLAHLGREKALRNLQLRAASVSLANLGLLLERFVQTGAGGGGSFFEAFAAGANNVQAILEARQKAQAKAAEQMQSARIVPALLAATLIFFMNDVVFRAAFQLPIVQLSLAGAAASMYLGYAVMSDMAREAV